MEHIDKPKQKNNKKDNLEKHEIEMTHQPFCCQIIPISNFDHKVFKCHKKLPNQYFIELFFESNNY